MFYGKVKGAPFAEQCPINHACEVIRVLNRGSHELIVGKIVESQVSEERLVGERTDPARLEPFLLAGFGFYAIGEHLGKPFS